MQADEAVIGMAPQIDLHRRAERQSFAQPLRREGEVVRVPLQAMPFQPHAVPARIDRDAFRGRAAGPGGRRAGGEGEFGHVLFDSWLMMCRSPCGCKCLAPIG